MTFEYLNPSNTAELKKLLKKKKKDAHILAGGTDLLVKLRHKTINPFRVIDIKNVRGINLIADNKKYVTIGAGVTLNQIAENPMIQKNYPALAIGARNIGSYQIRNRATLAGNICNSSPAADTAPALLIYDAKIHIISGSGKRVVSIHKFFKGPGKNILKDNECVESITMPTVKNKSVFYKFSRRRAVDLSTVCLAAGIFIEGKKREIKIAVGACAAVTARAIKAEKHLNKNGLNETSVKEATDLLPLKPISDLRGCADFRTKIAKQLFIRAIEELATETQRTQR